MSDTMERRLRAFGEDLAAAIAELAGTPIALAPAETPQRGGWRAVMTATGETPGRLVLSADGAAIAQLAAQTAAIPGQGPARSDDEVSALLRDVLSRAAVAAAGREADDRLALVVDTVEPAAAPDGESSDGLALEFALNGLSGSVPVALVWMPGSAARRGLSAGAAAASRLDVILDIELPVVVRFGHTQMPIRALSQLGPGSVIELGRSPDDPVEVLVSNRVVARGEVVIVGGNYGVRIMDVTSQSERARSMEG